MQAYIVTEAEKQALLTKLQLEKIELSVLTRIPLSKDLEAIVKDAVQQVHGRMHYEVCRLLS